MNKFYSFRFAFTVKAWLLAAIMLLSGSVLNAQITVYANKTAAQLANALVGSGVTIISPSLTCAGESNGLFTMGSIDDISLPNGIVLSSGAVVDTTISSIPYLGVANPASAFADEATGTPGDADLATLVSSSFATNDACILEFDFRPIGDTVKFSYVFASEEYPEYACTEFNDVFGFFISGPGYTGRQNIALVPGTTIPVAINSVNDGAGSAGGVLDTCEAMGPGSPFSAYYIDNSASTTIVYDGMTTVLQAIAAVTPCDTYHLKLGVCDVGDEAYDSGVFILGGSLSSPGVTVASVGLAVDTVIDGDTVLYCVRGCSNGAFIFSTNTPHSDSLTFDFVISGTAINGYDYDSLADSITLLPGVMSDTLFVNPRLVPATGPKSVKILIYSPYTCDGVHTLIDSAELLILDSFSLKILTPDTAICPGDSVHIITRADTLLSFLWRPSGTLNNDTLLSPVATPSVTTTYTITGTYAWAGGCPPVTDNITITVVNPDIQKVVHDSTCVSVTTAVNLATPGGSYSYSWSPTSYLSSGSISDPAITPTATGDYTYTVMVTPTAAFCPIFDTVTLHVVKNDFSILTPDTTICIGATVPVRVDGSTEYAYSWKPALTVSNPNIANTTIISDTSGKWTLTASYANCPDMRHSINVDVENPKVSIITPDSEMCLFAPMPITVGVYPADTMFTYSWSPSTYLTDASVANPFFYDTAAASHTYILTIATQLGCLSSDTLTLITAPHVKIVASPADTVIPYGSTIMITAENLLPQACTYMWTPDNGTLDNPNIHNPFASPVDSTTYTVIGMNQFGCRDSATVKIGIDYSMNETLPTAFTPNGDGKNDVFRLIGTKYQKLLDFRVFNRWGVMVFHTSDIKTGWDGTYNGAPQDMGVYNYMVIVARPDGTEKTYTGNVTLIR